MKITNRQTESLLPHIHENYQKECNYSKVILSSASDEGVMRNRGKNGAKYGPQCLLNSLKKMNNHIQFNENEKILSLNAWPMLDNFETNQLESSKIINETINKCSPQRVVHIGGGHDHIYPLLLAIQNSEKLKNILIINFDAHCDTRVDSIPHSGTPFRDFDNKSEVNFHLVQFGIHKYANSQSTLTPLENGSETKIFYNIDEQEMMNNLQQTIQNLPFEINDECAIVLSLDCDGIAGNQMPAVSCVNSLGLDASLVLRIINQFKSHTHSFFGIYEFNPAYDSASFQGQKLLTHLVYEYLS